jgi:uncharacterized membrane protein YfcA
MTDLSWIDVVGLVGLGLLAGTLVATLGIGGGIMFVPVLIFGFGFSQLDAQGTSLAVVVPTAVVATIGHARAHRVQWKIAAVAGVVGIGGALAGARLAHALDEAVLARVFAIVLGALAVRMAWRAWKLRPSSSPDGG